MKVDIVGDHYAGYVFSSSKSVDYALGASMSLRSIVICCAIWAVGSFVQPDCIVAQQGNAAGAPNAAPKYRDGQHDFDFELGSWRIHLKRLEHPLTGSNKWVEFDGTSVTRKVWDGRAQLEEFETDGSAGHIEGLTLRLYNPQSQQWSLYWATSKTGAIGIPTVGQFKDGVGEFYDHEEINGRMTLVRFLWTKTNSDSPHFEQSFSEDGGKTWELNWITDQTRVSDAPASGK
jgi:hypothetical protein